tara:strand:- start:217 stop:414 length:198 start_codon:yes stop_codon:yes gene_type:complete
MPVTMERPRGHQAMTTKRCLGIIGLAVEDLPNIAIQRMAVAVARALIQLRDVPAAVRANMGCQLV